MIFSSKSNFGDIIYSLPYCRAIAQDNNIEKFSYEIFINYPAHYDPRMCFDKQNPHPCGNVTVNREVADMLIPLLKAQPYIEEVIVSDYKKHEYTYNVFNLENFRTFGLDLSKFSITRWYTVLQPPTYIEDHSQWLFPDDHFPEYENTLVCARSSRYWGGFPLKSLYRYRDDILFIGTTEEHKSFEKEIGAHVEFKKLENFMEALNIIYSSKCFFGNQTGLTSVAVGLGTCPQIIETNKSVPNVFATFGANVFTEQNLIDSLKNYMEY